MAGEPQVAADDLESPSAHKSMASFAMDAQVDVPHGTVPDDIEQEPTRAKDPELLASASMPPIRTNSQGLKRPRSDSSPQPTPSERETREGPPSSPAVHLPSAAAAAALIATTPLRAAGSPARSGSTATGSTGHKASSYGRKPVMYHVLSNKAILPPHGRGRAPKVLPPLVMQRVATSSPAAGIKSGNPGSPSASGSQGRSVRARSDPRAKASPRSSNDPRIHADSSPKAADPDNSDHNTKTRTRNNSEARERARRKQQLTSRQLEKSATGSKSLHSGASGRDGSGASTASDAAAPVDRPDGGAEQDSGLRQQEQEQAAAPPIVEVSNGVRLVGPSLGRGRAPSTPSCFHPSRARWQQQGFAETEQNFGEEPLAAMLGWLREAARQVGHGDLFAPPLLDSLEAREYTQGFRRWRKSVYEGQPPLPPPTAETGNRRSGRHKGGASSSALTGLTGKKNEREYLEEESDEEKETREGPQFQAQPPSLCIRKGGYEGGPPEAEAALLSQRLLPPAAARVLPRHALVDLSTMTYEQRSEVVARTVLRLRKSLGRDKSTALGLDLIGLQVMTSRQWTDREAALLEEGMRLVGRDFRRIASSLLPGRSEADLILYYYNVWKTRATKRSRAWFDALEEARIAEAAEEAAEKIRLAELDAKRIAAQVVSNQTRHLRDALSWVRSGARWPKDSLTRHKPRERAVRIMALLAANNTLE